MDECGWMRKRLREGSGEESRAGVAINDAHVEEGDGIGITPRQMKVSHFSTRLNTVMSVSGLCISTEVGKRK